jgi:hypothetical protein
LPSLPLSDNSCALILPGDSRRCLGLWQCVRGHIGQRFGIMISPSFESFPRKFRVWQFHLYHHPRAVLRCGSFGHSALTFSKPLPIQLKHKNFVIRSHTLALTLPLPRRFFLSGLDGASDDSDLPAEAPGTIQKG